MCVDKCDNIVNGKRESKTIVCKIDSETLPNNKCNNGIIALLQKAKVHMDEAIEKYNAAITVRKNTTNVEIISPTSDELIKIMKRQCLDYSSSDFTVLKDSSLTELSFKLASSHKFSCYLSDSFLPKRVLTEFTVYLDILLAGVLGSKLPDVHNTFIDVTIRPSSYSNFAFSGSNKYVSFDAKTGNGVFLASEFTESSLMVATIFSIIGFPVFNGVNIIGYFNPVMLNSITAGNVKYKL